MLHLHRSICCNIMAGCSVAGFCPGMFVLLSGAISLDLPGSKKVGQVKRRI